MVKLCNAWFIDQPDTFAEMDQDAAAKLIDEILILYMKYGDADYIGEPVSQLEHMSQAAEFALQNNADDEVVLAAFFHDLGHICVARSKDNDMGGFGTLRHEEIGAGFLRGKGFPERVAALVEMHVQAKRYLTFAQPSYYQSLSEASRETLALQGGPMKAEEAAEFEQNQCFRDSLLLRRWDEMAKLTDDGVIDLAIIRDIAMRVLCNNSRG